MYLLLILDLIFFFRFDFLRYSKVQLVFSCVWFFRLFLGTDGDFCFFSLVLLSLPYMALYGLSSMLCKTKNLSRTVVGTFFF